MARGNAAKQEIFNKLLKVFPNSFMQDDKILRIVTSEDGTPVQIKVQLTAAKDLLSPEGEEPVFESGDYDFEAMNPPVGPEKVEPTQEEKDNVAAMLKALNL